MVLVCLAPESWSVWISTEEHFMAAKKKSVLARRVNELEDAVTRLFTGEPPAAKPAKRKKAKRKASKAKKAKAAVKRTAGKVKKAAKKVVRKAKRKAKKARR
jgi:hypothetical protein